MPTLKASLFRERILPCRAPSNRPTPGIECARDSNHPHEFVPSSTVLPFLPYKPVPFLSSLPPSLSAQQQLHHNFFLPHVKQKPNGRQSPPHQKSIRASQNREWLESQPTQLKLKHPAVCVQRYLLPSAAGSKARPVPSMPTNNSQTVVEHSLRLSLPSTKSSG